MGGELEGSHGDRASSSDPATGATPLYGLTLREHDLQPAELPCDRGRRLTRGWPPGHCGGQVVDDPGCPACGVIATKVHSRRLQRVRDVPVAGAVEVVWAKRRWFCTEELCSRGTFTEATAQVPRLARSTTRLKEQVVAAVITSGRAVSEVARAHGVSWWLVAAASSAAGWSCLTSTTCAPRGWASTSTATGQCGGSAPPKVVGDGSSPG